MKAKKRNPTDSTMRNIRSLNKKVADLRTNFLLYKGMLDSLNSAMDLVYVEIKILKSRLKRKK